MDIKDSYLHNTVGVVKSISVDADTLKYTLADKGGTVTNVVLPTATQSANGLLSKEDKIKLDNMIATQVANNLTLKINSGDVENTSLYTYNGSAAKTLDIKNGSGIGFTNDAGSLQIYNSGVRSIATGTTNGTISVDNNGTTANVAVKGLGSAAYTASDSYVKWNPTTYYNITLRSKIEGGHVRMYYSNIDGDSVFGYGYDNTSEEVYITNYKKSFGLKLGESLTYRNNVIAYTTSDITGNAATADKLKTKRKLWGLDFDGSADVSGNMTGVGTINTICNIQQAASGVAIFNIVETSADINYTHLYVTSGNTTATKTRPLVLQNGYGNVGIGVMTPTQKLEVDGNVKATSFIGNIDWSYIINKPTSYTPAAHTHNLLTWSEDVRSTATTPSDYKKTFKFVGIKEPTAVGLTTTIAGSYVSLFGWKGYSDNTGPKSWELASDNKDRIHVRSGVGIQNNGSGNENWSNWNTLAYTTDNFPSNQINTLTDYAKATEASSITATDSLNTALGKLEYKADVACDWITSVTAEDTDTLVNKWGEIVDFLDSVAEGTDIIDEFVTRKTTQTIIGSKTFSQYIKVASTSTTSGTTLHLTSAINYNSILFGLTKSDSTVVYSYLVHRGDADFRIANNGWTKEYNILHSGNSYIKNGVITINGTNITPLTSHLSLANYVTLDTELTITGKKTFKNSLTINSTAVNQTPKLVIDEYYSSTLGNWISEIISDYYGKNVCSTTNFTHGLYIKLGREEFNNLIILNNSNSPIARISKEKGHWFDGTLTTTGNISAKSGFLKSTANDKTITIGSLNASFCHFETTAPAYYFNKQIVVAGDIIPYSNGNYSAGNSSNRFSNIWSIRGNFTGLITSSIADGTAPLVITSSTKVNNLNVDLLDGLHDYDYFIRSASSDLAYGDVLFHSLYNEGFACKVETTKTKASLITDTTRYSTSGWSEVTNLTDKLDHLKVFNRDRQSGIELSSTKYGIRYTLTMTAYNSGKFLHILRGYTSTSTNWVVICEFLKVNASGTIEATLEACNQVITWDNEQTYIKLTSVPGNHNRVRITFICADDITSTNSVYLCTISLYNDRGGSQGMISNHGFKYANLDSIIPYSDNKWNLGSTGFKWKSVHATGFIGNLTGNVTGNVSGSSGSCTGNAATATSLATTKTVTQTISIKKGEWVTFTGNPLSNLVSGTYAILLLNGTNLVASGIMSFCANITDAIGDEIPLHVYTSNNQWRPYLRTSGTNLQIATTHTENASVSFTIKIARII